MAGRMVLIFREMVILLALQFREVLIMVLIFREMVILLALQSREVLIKWQV